MKGDLVMKNNKFYYEETDYLLISESTILIMKPFSYNDKFGMDYFIQYKDGSIRKVGTIINDNIKSMYIQTTNDYIAICYNHDDIIEVEELYDINNKKRITSEKNIRALAILKFKKQLFYQRWNELNELDKNEIKNLYQKYDVLELNSLQKLKLNILKHMISLKEQKIQNYQERIDSLHNFIITIENNKLLNNNDIFNLFNKIDLKIIIKELLDMKINIHKIASYTNLSVDDIMKYINEIDLEKKIFFK